MPNGNEDVKVPAWGVAMVGAMFTVTVALAAAWAQHITNEQDSAKKERSVLQERQSASAERLGKMEKDIEYIKQSQDRTEKNVDQIRRAITRPNFNALGGRDE